MEKLRLAIIGCGAIVQRIHLPVATNSEKVEVVLLVDKDLTRAQEVADQFSVPAVADDYRDVIQKAGASVDAAIVAIPNFLHGPVSISASQHLKEAQTASERTETLLSMWQNEKTARSSGSEIPPVRGE